MSTEDGTSKIDRQANKPAKRSSTSLALSRFSNAFSQRWHKILLLTAVAVTATSAYVLLRPSVYIANTEILVDNSTKLVTDLSDIGIGAASDSSQGGLGSELKLLMSSSTIDRVVDQVSTDIDQDAAFSMLEIWRLYVSEPPAFERARQTSLYRRSEIIRIHLDVEADPSTSVITVSYRSRNPGVAASVANGIAEAFLERRAEIRQRAIQQTLEEVHRLTEISIATIRTAQERGDGLSSVDELSERAPPPIEQHYARLSEELTNATFALARAKSRLAEANAVRTTEAFHGSTLKDELSPLGREFLERERELRVEIKLLGTRTADNTDDFDRAETQLALVRDAINTEVEQIRERFRLRIQAADAKVNELRIQVENIEANAPSVDSREVRTQRVYETVLERANQIVGLARTSVDNTRIIEPAVAPTSPNISGGLFLIGFVLSGSIGLGVLLTIAGELRRKGFNDSREVEAHFGQPVLAMLPTVQGVVPLAVKLQLSSREKHWALQGYTFIEGVRGLFNGLLPPRGDDPSPAQRVVAITSCFPDEGKTILALSLARQSTSGAAKVLLVEGDMRKVGLATKLSTVSAQRGLVDLLSGRVDNVDDVIVKEAESGVDLLLASGPSEDAFALSRSPRFKRAIKALKQRYDLIIIDCPPVLGVSDTLALCDAVDEIVFVIRWQETDRAAVEAAVRELAPRTVAGFVMTQVDLRSQLRDATASKYRYQDEFMSYGTPDGPKAPRPKNA